MSRSHWKTGLGANRPSSPGNASCNRESQLLNRSVNFQYRLIDIGWIWAPVFHNASNHYGLFVKGIRPSPVLNRKVTHQSHHRSPNPILKAVIPRPLVRFFSAKFDCGDAPVKSFGISQPMTRTHWNVGTAAFSRNIYESKSYSSYSHTEEATLVPLPDLTSDQK